MHEEVTQYIKDAKEYGLTDQQIKQNLLNEGWEADAVNKAFVYAKAESHRLAGNKDEDFILPKAAEVHQRPEHIAAHQPIPHEIPQIPREVTEHLQNFQSLPQKTEQAQTSSVQVLPAQMVNNPIHAEAQNISGHHEEILKKNQGFQKKFFAVLAAVLILGAAGAYFYFYVYASPAKIWNKFVAAGKMDSYHSTVNISYTDDSSKILNKTLTEPAFVDVNFTLDSDVQQINEQDENLSAKANIKISAGETMIEQGINFKLIDKVFYFKISDIPQLKETLSPIYKIEGNWIKVDAESLQEQLNGASQVLGTQIIALMDGNSETNAQEDLSANAFSEQLDEDLNKIWEDPQLWGMEKYLGTENINGVKTAHFKNFIDKEKLKTNSLASIDILANSASSQLGETIAGDSESLIQIKDIISQVIDKIEVKEFETWVGIKDFQLYKFHLVLEVPSFTSIAQGGFSDSIPGLATARAKSRNALRLTDMRQMASALELFYSDKNGYPEGLQGVPQGMSPFYIGVIPTAPLPSDGNCSDYFNTYWYTPIGEPVEANGVKLYPNYEYTFCLGDNTGGYSSGIAKMTYAGIEGGLSCTGTTEQCFKEQETGNKDFLSNLDFTAELKIISEFSNYGQKHDFSVPNGAVDITELQEKEYQGLQPSPELAPTQF